MRARAREWADMTGNRLEYISRPNSSTETLSLYNQYWAAQSADVDVYLIDVIWPGIAAPHAVDLRRYFEEDEIKPYFPRIIENNTVDGMLIAFTTIHRGRSRGFPQRKMRLERLAGFGEAAL